MLVVLYELGDDVFDIAVDDVVGNLVDGGIRIVVYGDDDAGILHTGDVLDLTGDAAGNINLRMNGDTGLTNLTVVVYPTCINSCTGSTYLTMQEMSQLEELVETFLASYTITAGYNDGRTLQVVLGSLYMVVEYLYDEVLGRYILAYLWVNNFLLALTLIDALLHHT